MFLLAWLDWQAAGTGVSHTLNGAAEIVGIVTDKHHRRRGVASSWCPPGWIRIRRRTR